MSEKLKKKHKKKNTNYSAIIKRRNQKQNYKIPMCRFTGTKEMILVSWKTVAALTNFIPQVPTTHVVNRKEAGQTSLLSTQVKLLSHSWLPSLTDRPSKFLPFSM